MDTTDAATMRPIVNIEGERVALGPLRRDLVPLYQRWVNDFAVRRTTGHLPAPLTVEQETAWYERTAAAERTVAFTVYARAAWRPIGTADWHGINERDRTAALGIMIGAADARGRGYGTEATRLMLDYAFTVLGLHSATLTVYAYNIAGLRAYAKAGFKECGRRRERRWLGGRWWDEVLMDCLASEFASPVLAQVFHS